MAAIFVSYRREDSQSATGRLADDLAKRFGEEAVFRDVHAIEAGEDFTRAIEDGIRNASAVLVVIGRHWLDAQSPEGGRRLDQESDYVRQEIQMALTARVPVIPILVEGAAMPGEDDLPKPLRSFSKTQAHPLTEQHWRYDTDQLASRLWHDFEIEPVELEPAITASERLESLRRYPFHLATLILRPKRFLATRVYGRRRSAVDALIFFALSTVIAVWLATAEWPGKSWELFLAATGTAVIFAVILSVPFYGAWRLVGSGAQYQRIVTILFYQVSVLHLGLGLAGLLLFMSFNMSDPGLLLRLRESIAADGATRIDTQVQALMGSRAWRVVSPYLGGLLIALCAWFVTSWGAYRRTLGLSRIRSLTAFLLAFAFPPLLVLFTALTSTH